VNPDLNPVEMLLTLLDEDTARELREVFYASPPDAATVVACAIASGVKDDYFRLGIEALTEEEK